MMGRAQRRQQEKYIKSKLSSEGYNKMIDSINYEFINEEVNKRCNFFKSIFSDCLIEAMKNNGISNTKATQILDDMDVIMLRKVSESNGKS